MSTSTAPSPRPVVIFDGDCGICTRLAGLTRERLRPRAAVEPWQQLNLEAYGLDARTCDEALQYVDAQGRVYGAERAVSRLLLISRPWARPIGLLIGMPGIRRMAGFVYRWVARHRHRLPGGTAACAIRP